MWLVRNAKMNEDAHPWKFNTQKRTPDYCLALICVRSHFKAHCLGLTVLWYPGSVMLGAGGWLMLESGSKPRSSGVLQLPLHQPLGAGQRCHQDC